LTGPLKNNAINSYEILYVCRKQFGYSIDNYYHCKYLRDHYKITYLSPDVGWEKIEMAYIKTPYVIFNNNRIMNNIRFYLVAIKYIYNPAYKLVILNRSYFFFLFRIFHPFKTFIYDIRSGIVKPNTLKRKFFTSLLKLDLLFYKNISIISDSLARKLNIKKYLLLPLGAESFQIHPKTFNKLQLIYVGTFNNRRIEDTIAGFNLFLKSFDEKINLSYHIYGFGSPETEAKIIQFIKDLQLSDKIFFHGKIHPSEVKDKLSKHNIGVSYIPITPYFDVQPPTKTFEYLLAGMPVIATNTQENARVIKPDNGVLISDTPEEFKKGLEVICRNIMQDKYSSVSIAGNSKSYTWEYIVLSIFKPYIDNILDRTLT
jgi:hypothetical protein